MMNDIKGLIFVIFYAVCGECLYAQSHVGAKSFFNKDLSCLFKDLGMIGILGDDYSRIDVRIIKARKLTDTCYEVRGATRTRLTIICQLRGKIFIDSIISDPKKSEVINMDGMIYGHYSLNEIGNERYCGTFTGTFKQAFSIEDKKIDKATNDILELKLNLSEYIGKWQSRYGKFEKSNWADEIIPEVPNDFCSFNDAGEWIVNPTYRKCGWDNLYNAYYNFQLPEDEIIKARDIEECEWYMKNEDTSSNRRSYPLENGYELCYEIINDSIQQYVLIKGNDEKVISSEPYYGELNDKFSLHYDNIDFDDYVVLVRCGSNYYRKIYLFSKKSGENIFKDKCYIEVDYDMNENLILYFNAQNEENPNGNLALFDLKNQRTIEIDVELFAKNKQLSNYYYNSFSILNANNTYVTIAYSDEDMITNTFKRDTPKEHSDTLKGISRFNLEYYQKKMQENCGELSIPFSCYYTELDGTQKHITITDKGYSLSIIRPRSFLRELKLYHKNKIIKMEGTKLFMSSVNVGIWREYNEEGTLINETDEDRKFDSLRFKPLDVLRYIEREGYISLKTGEGQERFDKQNGINIYFKNKQKSENLWSKREPAKWMLEFYDIEKGYVITHVINAESGGVISKTIQFLEE